MSNVYTPAFNEDRAFLTPFVLKYLSKCREANIIQVGRYIKELAKIVKGENKERLELISYDFMSDYSEEIHDCLVDMVRHCLIEETLRGYRLTRLGSSYAGKKLEELLEDFKKEYGVT